MSISAKRDTAIGFLKGSVGGGARPGDILGPNLFKGPVHIPVVMADGDIPTALDYATEQGWVENLGPGLYRLTNAGFAVAQSAN